jgi:DNA-binding GntR family transcriptional regulator
MATMKNVHGNTLDHLGEAIVAGRYGPGESIPPEPRLREALGVSRTVIRETVKSLVGKGLVSTGPKVGTRVLPEENWTRPQLRADWSTSAASMATSTPWTRRPEPSAGSSRRRESGASRRPESTGRFRVRRGCPIHSTSSSRRQR